MDMTNSSKKAARGKENSHLMTSMKTFRAALIASLLLATSILPAGAQDRDHRDHHDNRNNSTFYNGVRRGGRGGHYNDPRYDNRRYNNGRYNNGGYYNEPNQGGIGPGKGALIGGAGGAVLGAVFGGGLKGTLIGGAAGAGIGAVVGKVHQDNQNNNQYYPR
jgi:hypothetical protein